MDSLKRLSTITNFVIITITIKILVSSEVTIGLALCLLVAALNYIHKRTITSQIKIASSTSTEDVSKQLALISQKTEELESKINPIILASGMKSTRQ